MTRLRGAAWHLCALLLVVAAAGQAAPFTVERDDSVRALHAERHDMGARLDVVATAIEQAAAAQPASGTEASPAELSEGNTPAGTSVTRGHWTYVATLRERAAADIASGRFVVQLRWNDVVVGQAHLQQAIPNPLAQEGARVTFDLGTTQPPDAPLFLVTVRAAATAAVAHTLTSAYSADLQGNVRFVWRDDGGADNPTLAARAGVELILTIVNGEGTAPHNLAILDGATVVARTEDEVAVQGERAQLRWTPPDAREYAYVCEFHSSMKGTLQVSPA